MSTPLIPNAANCICDGDEKILRRLLKKFAPAGNRGPALGMMDTGTWLDLYEEDVQELVDLGFFGDVPPEDPYSGARLDLRAVLDFLEARPWWFEEIARLRMQALRDAVAHEQRRAEAEPKADGKESSEAAAH